VAASQTVAVVCHAVLPWWGPNRLCRPLGVPRVAPSMLPVSRLPCQRAQSPCSKPTSRICVVDDVSRAIVGRRQRRESGPGRMLLSRRSWWDTADCMRPRRAEPRLPADRHFHVASSRRGSERVSDRPALWKRVGRSESRWFSFEAKFVAALERHMLRCSHVFFPLLQPENGPWGGPSTPFSVPSSPLCERFATRAGGFAADLALHHLRQSRSWRSAIGAK